jgi:hypothetical protein
MLVDTLACLLLVLGVTIGLSRPIMDRLSLGPAESLVGGAALSLLAAWAAAWAVFVSGAPLSGYWLVPLLGLAGLAAGLRGLRRLAADPLGRDLIIGQLLVSAWCVACLSFVRTYSGGAWLGDWLEHWQRARFFLRDWPTGQLFFDIYAVPARPPLSNVLTAVFLRVTAADYARYQVVMAVLSSLAYLPAGLLAARFGGRQAARVAAAVLMVNPLFVQNTTYPWTKLQAAFFILSGLYFFLRLRDQDCPPRTPAVLCALCLGAAVVTHYSAGPYVVTLALAWVGLGFRRGWGRGFAPATLLAACAGAAAVAPWFAWSLSQYGWHGTFLSNSTVSMFQKAPGNPLVTMALNLRDSLLPPQVRGFAGTLFRQQSPWGSLRDQAFLVYQLNPLLALGCVGWIAAARGAFLAARAADRRERSFWVWALLGIVTLSFASYGDRDHYGTGHICLQSLVLLGLAFLASRWGSLGPAWRRLLVLGWAADLLLGVALQLAVEDFALDRWLRPAWGLREVSQSYGVVAQENLSEKIIAHFAYFADSVPTPPALLLALLGALLCMALVRARRAPGEA